MLGWSEGYLYLKLPDDGFVEVLSSRICALGNKIASINVLLPHTPFALLDSSFTLFGKLPCLTFCPRLAMCKGLIFTLTPPGGSASRAIESKECQVRSAEPPSVGVPVLILVGGRVDTGGSRDSRVRRAVEGLFCLGLAHVDVLEWFEYVGKCRRAYILVKPAD